jgi:hypothetical protein
MNTLTERCLSGLPWYLLPALLVVFLARANENAIRIGMPKAKVAEMLKNKGDAFVGAVSPYYQPSNGFRRANPDEIKARWANDEFVIEVIFNVKTDRAVSIKYIRRY